MESGFLSYCQGDCYAWSFIFLLKSVDIFGYAGGRVCLSNFLFFFSLNEFFARVLAKYFECICGISFLSLYSLFNYIIFSDFISVLLS